MKTKFDKTYEIISATPEHAAELAPVMREPDVAELWAAAHQEPLDALRVSLEATRDPRAALADGVVMCIFGVGTTTLLAELGVPWMMGTDALEVHARAFLRGSREWIEEMKEEFPLMRNQVDARNVVAIRWLKWIGFDILPAAPYGLDQLPFHPFQMERV